MVRLFGLGYLFWLDKWRVFDVLVRVKEFLYEVCLGKFKWVDIWEKSFCWVLKLIFFLENKLE